MRTDACVSSAPPYDGHSGWLTRVLDRIRDGTLVMPEYWRSERGCRSEIRIFGETWARCSREKDHRGLHEEDSGFWRWDDREAEERK